MPIRTRQLLRQIVSSGMYELIFTPFDKHIVENITSYMTDKDLLYKYRHFHTQKSRDMFKQLAMNACQCFYCTNDRLKTDTTFTNVYESYCPGHKSNGDDSEVDMDEFENFHEEESYYGPDDDYLAELREEQEIRADNTREDAIEREIAQREMIEETFEHDEERYCDLLEAEQYCTIEEEELTDTEEYV